MPPLYSPDDLLQAICDVLQAPDVAKLRDFWGRRAAAAATAATQEVVGRLTARGYSPAQVQGWDRAAEYVRSIGLYFALLDGGARVQMLPEQVRLYDRRKELDTVPVTVGGGLVALVAAGAAGGTGVSGGRMSEAGYRFRMDQEF